jgi:TonB family protein
MRRWPVWLVFALAMLTVAKALAQDPGGREVARATAVPVRLPHPVYPAIAQSARVQGIIEVTVTVRSDGSVASAVIAGKDIPLLSPAALAAAGKAEFECRGCAGTPAHYSIVYVFTFEGSRTTVRDEDQPEPVHESAGQSRVTTLAETPECDHCGGHMYRPARSAKCVWLWKCGVK